MTEQVTERTIENVASDIAGKFHPQKIILFGSYAWGKPGPDSDVDLLVVKEVDDTRRLAREIDGAVFPRPFPLDVLVCRPEKLTKAGPQDFFLRDILARGKVLYAK
ncbi:MAG: nucleotidyltransferase domain-containing protein [Candidatus Liptonbacteria bacterium]|nr:nucleotidyltransferase domain-containing protein [Candidatus Liptonbacteria bacterium]